MIRDKNKIKSYLISYFLERDYDPHHALIISVIVDYSEQSGSSSILVNHADFASIIFLNS